ncbi:Integral membrane protein [Lasiodiplodia theobromae]|uniref:Integral membrane protein n=1 Tax=Lasiodiplodia theobromae TaxID=45133 RepID=UPI0015C3C3FC|nr:Integral membrane protein [Lasiodiplodia theobromae]KAF4545160.1 Integral membrane protein [Lasiodiplodia theobromae]
MAPALNPIDYYVPVVNRGITIRASSLTCMLVSWVACWALFGAITLNNEIPNGLGLHEWTIITENPDGTSNYETYSRYLMWFYLTNVSYAGATSSIKLSLLLQYLRIFPRNTHPTMFRILLGLIAIVTTWGVTYLFLIIFACTPVDKSWNLMKEGKCIMFGDFHPRNAYTAYASQTASNMFLDTIILITPIPLLYKTRVGKRAKFGLIGLFSAGSLVVTTASLRLWFVIKNRAGTHPTIDPPWYAPPIILMSVLEVNLAILTASMPIFWPYLAHIGGSGIKVMQEVIVRSEPRKAPYQFSNASLTGPSPSPYPQRRNTTETTDDDDDAASMAKNGSAIVATRQRSNSDASNRRLTIGFWDEVFTAGGVDRGSKGSKRKDSSASNSQYRRENHYTEALPYDGERHRLYYGDPTVAELVVGDLFAGEPGGESSRGGGAKSSLEREVYMGTWDERVTGNQATAWFEPEPVALEDLRGRGKGK